MHALALLAWSQFLVLDRREFDDYSIAAMDKVHEPILQTVFLFDQFAGSF